MDRTRILESVAAHFLAAILDWQHDGLRPAVDRWIGRVLGADEPDEFTDQSGEVVRATALGLGEDGLLIIRGEDGTVRQAPARMSSWPGSMPAAFEG